VPSVRTVSALLLALVMAATLGGEAAHAAWPGRVAGGGVVLYLLLEWRHLGLSGKGLVLAAGAAAVAAAATLPDGGRAVGEGLGRAAFFATFITALGLLRQAALGSPLVRRCGRLLVHQPPARRYAALSLGGHLFGNLVHAGGVALLATMIRQGSGAITDPAARAVREQRAGLAAYRGYAATILWSPLTVGMAILLASFPGVTWPELALPGAGLAAAFMALGWGLDAVAGGRRGAAEGPRPAGDGTAADLGRLVALVAGIMGLAFAVAGTLSVRLVPGLLMSVPVVTVAWLMWRARLLGPPAAGRLALRHLARRARHAFPAHRGEIAVLAAAGMLGVAGLAALPDGAVAGLAAVVPSPAWLAGVVLPWGLLALGLVGVAPVVGLTLAAGVLGGAGVGGVPPEAAALALGWGFVMSVIVSPASMSLLMLARLMERPVTRVGLGWNLGFAALALVAFNAGFLALYG